MGIGHGKFSGITMALGEKAILQGTLMLIFKL
jgi:hypothetical protein